MEHGRVFPSIDSQWLQKVFTSIYFNYFDFKFLSLSDNVLLINYVGDTNKQNDVQILFAEYEKFIPYACWTTVLLSLTKRMKIDEPNLDDEINRPFDNKNTMVADNCK